MKTEITNTPKLRTVDQLPSLESCAKKHYDPDVYSTALEDFITLYQPDGKMDGIEFRFRLIGLINAIVIEEATKKNSQ